MKNYHFNHLIIKKFRYFNLNCDHKKEYRGTCVTIEVDGKTMVMLSNTKMH